MGLGGAIEMGVGIAIKIVATRARASQPKAMGVRGR